ncbi:MAG: pyridoxal phosphate-dependent aminotransferase [Gemmataceae bacterium]
MSCPLFLARLLVRTRLANWLPSVRRLLEGGSGFLPYYSDRVLTAPVMGLKSAANLLERRAGDAVDLALGEPHFDLLPSGSTKLPADQRGWPSPNGLAELRAAVAEKLQADNGVAVQPQDEVLITHGAAGAFYTALDSFVNPGDGVVLFDPASPLFGLALKHRRARVRWIHAWMEEGRTRFRLAQLARALRGAKLLILNTPANPTGGVLSLDDLEQIAWWANRHDVLIYSDEVFERYQYEGEHISIASLPGAGRRTLTVGSLSKGHALAAARVGWLAGCRHLVRPCAVTAAMQAPFVPTLCQQICLTALKQEGKYFEPIRAGFEYRRRYAFERLQAMGLNPAWPGGGYFLWMPVWDRDMSGEVFADRLLADKKVLVTPGDLFGPSGKGYVRLSFATEDGRLREGLRRLAEFVEPHQLAPASEKQAA